MKDSLELLTVKGLNFCIGFSVWCTTLVHSLNPIQKFRPFNVNNSRLAAPIGVKYGNLALLPLNFQHKKLASIGTKFFAATPTYNFYENTL